MADGRIRMGKVAGNAGSADPNRSNQLKDDDVVGNDGFQEVTPFIQMANIGRKLIFTISIKTAARTSGVAS